MSELLPCPFCGAPAKEFDGETDGYHYVTCSADCDVGPCSNDKEAQRSRKQWNRRAAPDHAVPARVADGVAAIPSADEVTAKEQSGAAPEPAAPGNTGHGHVYPRPDGVRARCGGPGLCRECSADQARKNQESTPSVSPQATTAVKLLDIPAFLWTGERPCTCHPDDNPPVPCPKKYALAECRAAAAQGPTAEGADWVRVLSELEAKATQSPWRVYNLHRVSAGGITSPLMSYLYGPLDDDTRCVSLGSENKADHELVVALRNAWPQIKAVLSAAPRPDANVQASWIEEKCGQCGKTIMLSVVTRPDAGEESPTQDMDGLKEKDYLK